MKKHEETSGAEEAPPSNLFTLAMAQVGYGDLNETASDHLANVIRGVISAGKKGKIVITLEVKPRGKDNQIELAGDVKATIPVAPIAPAMVFALENGGFQTEHPGQKQLDLGPRKAASNE